MAATNGVSLFTPIYHSVFGHLREQPIRLLEIGVGGYEFRRVGGASLAMWADYFPNGKIAGIDVEEKELDLGPRVTVLRGSQVDAEFLERVVAEHGPFDIIVDDGSHVPQHIVASFGHLFPSLTANGIYAIEDTLTAFMPKKGEFRSLGARRSSSLRQSFRPSITKRSGNRRPIGNHRHSHRLSAPSAPITISFSSRRVTIVSRRPCGSKRATSTSKMG